MSARRAALAAALVACAAETRQTLRPRTATANTDAPVTVTRLGVDEPTVPAPGLAGATATRFIGAGLRAQVATASVALADERLGAPLLAAVEVAGGWVFATADGVVSASERFTGRLRPVGTVPGLQRAGAWSRGRLCLTAREGLWCTDGDTLARVTTLDAPVFEAAFADASAGAAVLDDGRYAVTTDGGATWRVASLEGAIALVPRYTGTSLQIVTTRGPVSTEGSALPAQRADVEVDASTALTLVAQALRDRVPTHQRLPSVRLADGAWASLDGREVVRADARGRERGRVQVAERDVPGRLARWGDAVALRADRLYVSRDGQRFEPVGPDGGEGWPGEAYALSDDGVRAALPGPCATTSMPDVADRIDTVCARDGRGRWHAIPLAAATLPERGVRRAMHGATLLLGAADRTSGRGFRYVTIDTETGATRDVAPPEGMRFTATLEWTRAGTLRGVVEAGELRLLATGSPEGPWVTSPLPEGALSVAFADAQRGVAFGARLSSLWRTLNGGEFWARVPVGASVRAARLSPQPDGVCDEGGCTVDDVARVEGWGPIRESAEGDAAGATDERPRRASELLASVVSLRCEATGAATPSPLREGGAAHWSVGAASARSSVGVAQVSWQSEGMRAPATALVEGAGGSDLVVLGAGMGALVADRGAAGTLAWMRGRTSRALTGMLPGVGGWTRGGAEAWLVLPTRDGGVVALSASSRSPRRIATAFEVDATGNVRGVHTAAVETRDEPFPAVGLIERGALWSVVTATAGAMRVGAWGGAVTEEPNPHASVRACAVARSGPRRMALWVPYGRGWGRRLEVGGEAAAVGVVELEGAEARCVRGVRVQMGSAVHTLRSDGEAMVGWRDDGTQRTPERCTLRVGEGR